MKNPLSWGLKIARKKAQHITISTSAVMISSPAFAGGLSKMKGGLDSFMSDYTLLIPTVATLALMVIGLGYSMKFLQKQDVIQWGIGILIVGSAGTLAAAFLQ